MCVHLTGGREAGMLSSGQRFMTDLLVSSLMADGGLETALDAAFRKETADMEEARENAQEDTTVETDSEGVKTQEAVLEAESKKSQNQEGDTSIPLLQLVQQLLR